MFTIKDYLKYYKDVSFNSCNFNEVDNLFFTSLSYFDWTDIVKDTKVNLIDAVNKLLDKKKVMHTPFMKDNLENLKIIKDSKRYRECYLGNFKSIIDNRQQFGAICIYFEDKVYVSFEGTDNSVIGWKEDFNLAYIFPTVTQVSSVDYLNKVITKKDKTIYVGGHSKGGNLAMMAFMYCDNSIKKRIKYVFNNDGPGFMRKQYLSKEFKEMLPKLRMYIPEESVVGLLLFGSHDYKVVKSTAKGINQHNFNTWKCFGSFLQEGKLSRISDKLIKRIEQWYMVYDDEDFEIIITSLFKVLEDNKIKNFIDLKKLSWKEIRTIINHMSNIDSSTKKLYLEALKDFIWFNGN